MRIARRTVPGRGTPQLRLLSSGLLHDTYRVDRDGHSFSMRLAAPRSRATLQVSLQAAVPDEAWVLRVLQLAADRTLSPPLIYGDAEGGIVVQAWVAGRAWPASSVKTKANLDRFAALLRQVHALPVPTAAHNSGPALWMRKYGAALAAQARSAKRGAKRAANGTAKPTAVPPLAEAAARHLARFEALPGVASVLCHSDLHRLNVLEYRPKAVKNGAKSLLLLDWEYAHVSEPFWDLAGWSANNDFPDDLTRRLLAAYLGRAPAEADWTRCRLLAWLYDYVCLLWSQLYLCSRPGSVASDVRSRAAVLRARLGASAG
jgi:thiamine kinase-like enzyme